MTELRSFVLNGTDLAYILAQVNFIPLFTANGDAVISWDGQSVVYDQHGTLLYDPSLPNQSFTGTAPDGTVYVNEPLTESNVLSILGQSFPTVTNSAGIRDISGEYNNLNSGDAAHYWGVADHPFIRLIPSNTGDYLAMVPQTHVDPTTGQVVVDRDPVTHQIVFTNNTANYDPFLTVYDAAPRIISQTITTGGVTLLADADGHVAFFNGSVYDYTDKLVDANIDVSTLNPGDVIPGLTHQEVLLDVNNHAIRFTAALYDTAYLTDPVLSGVDLAKFEYTRMLSDAGVNVSGLQDGDFVRLPDNSLLLYPDNTVVVFHSADYVAGYETLDFDPQASAYTHLLDSLGIDPIADGIPNGATLTVTVADTWQPTLYDPDYKAFIDTNVVDPSKLVDGAAIVADLGEVGDLGNPDYQNADSSEFFVGATNPGVAPVNGWFALFGQFFDHGLDFIDKSGQYGKVVIPLQPDDPLYGAIGPDGRPVTSITISRAVVDSVDADGNAVYINHTSPFIDQSQTYGSNEQVTNILREWTLDPTTGKYHAGMNMLDGSTLVNSWTKADGTVTHDTLPTLAELNAHLVATGRDPLTWDDVNNLRQRDVDGKVIHDNPNTVAVEGGGTGHALLLDMNPHFDTAHFTAETKAALANTFIKMQMGPTGPYFLVATKVADGQYETSNGNGGTTILTDVTGYHAILPDAATGTYAVADLMAIVNFSSFAPMQSNTEGQGALAKMVLFDSVSDHYVAGDGRVNENFGLTSIHHVFHEEHNYQVDNLIAAIYKEDAHQAALTDPQSGDDPHRVLHGFQVDRGFGTDAQGNYIVVWQEPVLAPDGSPLVINGQAQTVTKSEISWDQDKMFDAAKVVVEMEYQHTAVDQYARSVTPDIPEFVGYNSGVDPSISLEYGQAAFRFGHSTLRETIDAIDPSQGLTGKIVSYALELGFLNPKGYSEVGPGAIALGMTHQQMAEIDEIVTPALNQGLLNQPLDLAAINIARGRDIGLPMLNDVREALGFARYDSWASFGENMIHPDSLVNFMAAYSFNGDLSKAKEIMGLLDGTVLDGAGANHWTFQQALNFINNTPNGNNNIAGADAVDLVDTWIGGLAEAHISGGMLGEVFNVIFVDQIVRLEDGDRFYYLYRLVNQQFADEIGNEQFKDIIERNTGISHLNGSAFSYADRYYDVTQGDTLTPGSDHTAHEYYDLFQQYVENDRALGVITRGGSEIQNGTILTDFVATEFQKETRLNISFDGLTMHMDQTSNAQLQATAQDYVLDMRDVHAEFVDPLTGEVMMNLDDTPVDGADSSEVYVGTNANDIIYMGAGDDTAYGEDGNDIIYGGYGIDRLYGGDGDDIIHGGDGAELIDGGDGDDVIYGDSSGTAAAGVNQVIGGAGNDVIYAGQGIDKIAGGGGDDVIYGLGDTDPFTHGGDGNDYIDGGQSGDLLYGDNGDDVIVGGNDQDVLMGGRGDDILRPGNPSSSLAGFGPDEVLGGDGTSDLGNDGESVGFDLIDFSDYNAGAQPLTVDLANQSNPLVAIDQTTPMPAMFQIEGVVGTQNGDAEIGDAGGNWLIGGSGADMLTGLGGNDIIVGDSIRLDSLIGTYAANAHDNGYTSYDEYTLANFRNMNDLQTNGLIDAANALNGFAGSFDKHFTELLRSRMFKDYVLGIDEKNNASGGDTVVFSGNSSDYVIRQVSGGGVTGYLIKGIANQALADGTDMVVGVETFKFLDGTFKTQNTAPEIASFVNAAGVSSNLSGNGSHGPQILTSVRENSKLVGTLNIVDPDIGNPFLNNQQVSATLSGTHANLFNLVRKPDGTYALEFKNAPDFENPAHGPYNVTVTASDGIATDIQDFVVSVENIVPSLTIDNYSYSTQSGGRESLHVSSSDPSAAGFLWERRNGTGTTGSPFTWSTQSGSSATFSASTIPGVYRTSQLEAGVRYYSETVFVGSDSNQSSGRDNLTGTAGIDLMIGNGNNDTLNGGDGNDRIDGGNGDDNLVGGNGSDSLLGGNNNDQMDGGADNDHLEGGSGSDTLTGGLGDDSLDGGTGNDTDTAVFTNSALEYTTTSTGTGSLTVKDNVIGNGNEGTDALINFQSGSDRLRFGNTTYQLQVGTAGADIGNTLNFANSNSGRYILALAGNDTVNGSSSSDYIDGGDGIDLINGNNGNDIILGGAGNDTITQTSTNSGRDYVSGGDGTDTFQLNTNLSSVEQITIYTRAAALADVANGQLSAAALGTLAGDSEIIIVRRTAGNGGFGNATVLAELSTIEELRVHLGANSGPTGDSVIVKGNFDTSHLAYNTITIDGTRGNETIDITGLTSAHRIVFHTAGGQDHVVGTLRSQDIVDVNIPTDPSNDHGNQGGFIVGTVDDDDIDGSEGNDTFIAAINDGNDHFNGLAGFDTVDYSVSRKAIKVDLREGTGQSATAVGEQIGDDRLTGIENVKTGSGNDTIAAGNAINVMAGGSGSDAFVFRTATAADGDIIKDFSSSDWLNLRAIDADVGIAGNQAFHWVDHSFDRAAQLRVSYVGTGADEKTVLQGNTDSDIDAEFTLVLDGHQRITDHFIL